MHSLQCEVGLRTIDVCIILFVARARANVGCDTVIESGGVVVHLRKLIGGKLLRASPDPLNKTYTQHRGTEEMT